MLRILVADDHSIVREGLKRIVDDTDDIVVAGEASDGDRALGEALNNDYDAILLDISMPGRGWLDIVREIRDKKPKLPILILSMHPEEQYARRAFGAGASGYVTKGTSPDELIAAIRKISSGGRYVSPSLAEKLAGYLQIDAEQRLHDTLSDREYEVMLMMASGKTLKEIARELSVSIKTVSTYRSRILMKMGMERNAELIRYAERHQLVV
jgi:two-component system invasion response regulator UvrY